MRVAIFPALVAVAWAMVLGLGAGHARANASRCLTACTTEWESPAEPCAQQCAPADSLASCEQRKVFPVQVQVNDLCEKLLQPSYPNAGEHRLPSVLSALSLSGGGAISNHGAGGYLGLRLLSVGQETLYVDLGEAYGQGLGTDAWLGHLTLGKARAIVAISSNLGAGGRMALPQFQWLESEATLRRWGELLGDLWLRMPGWAVAVATGLALDDSYAKMASPLELRQVSLVELDWIPRDGPWEGGLHLRLEEGLSPFQLYRFEAELFAHWFFLPYLGGSLSVVGATHDSSRALGVADGHSGGTLMARVGVVWRGWEPDPRVLTAANLRPMEF